MNGFETRRPVIVGVDRSRPPMTGSGRASRRPPAPGRGSRLGGFRGLLSGSTGLALVHRCTAAPRRR
ncbi:hypothetical protein [Kitasatospora sp. NPDC127060]|uniref:hypothetical protein n=1 Tax=Kitasatospora sp. NPDC127060 TaxID=3347121 RepID=UPI003667172C